MRTPPLMQRALGAAWVAVHQFDKAVRKSNRLAEPLPSASEATMTTEKLAAKRAELRAKGINLRALCEERGINYAVARQILSGRIKGYYGDAHDAAVALGLKPAPATRELEAA